MTRKKPPGPKGPGTSAGPIIRYTFDDGTIERVPLVDVLAQLYEGTSQLLRAKQQQEAERAKQPREAAKEPRPKARKVDSDDIRRQYDELIKARKDDREARSMLLAKGKWTYLQIYRAIKKT